MSEYVSLQLDQNSYRLKIDGLVDNPQELTCAEVLAQEPYHKVVGLNCVEEWAVRILREGVLVRDLLAKAGPRPDAHTVILHAADGYTTSFPVEWLHEIGKSGFPVYRRMSRPGAVRWNGALYCG